MFLGLLERLLSITARSNHKYVDHVTEVLSKFERGGEKP
jgi:hypothetical protein